MDALPIEQLVIFLAAPDPCLDGVFTRNPDTLPDVNYRIEIPALSVTQAFPPFTFSVPSCLTSYPVQYEWNLSNDDSTTFNQVDPQKMYFDFRTESNSKIGKHLIILQMKLKDYPLN